jgi:hypothetical protein
MYYAQARSGISVKFLWKSKKERGHWEDEDIGGRIIISVNLEKQVVMLTGFIWLITGTSGRLLLIL